MTYPAKATTASKGAPLSAREEAFCRAYVTRPVGAQAARDAGYPPTADPNRASVIAWELLKRPDIQERIAQLVEDREREPDLQARDVLRELIRIAFADLADAFNEDGSLKPVHEIPEYVRKAISSIKTDELWEGKGKAREQVGVVREVKFWNKENALHLLGKQLSLFRDVLTLRDGRAEVDDNALAARVASIIEELRRREKEAEGLF